MFPLDPQSPARRDAVPQPFAAARWLVVEQDAAVRAAMVRVLGSLQAGAIRFARDGLEAIVALDAEPADLVLMNLDLPWMGGAEASALLRARGHRMPIIGCSDRVVPAQRRASLAAGMDAFLGKPLCSVQLAECLAGLGGRARAAAAPQRRRS